MATPRKVTELLRVIESENGFLNMSKVAANHLAASLLASGDVEGAASAEIFSTFWTRIEPLVQDQVVAFIGEQFTDDDLDKIIAYRLSPVAQKTREAIPLFQHQISTFLEDNDQRMRQIMKDIFEEFKTER